MKKKGFNHSVERFEGDENRRQHLLAFWDFCRDCFGEEQEVPLPGNEALLYISHSHLISCQRKPPL